MLVPGPSDASMRLKSAIVLTLRAGFSRALEPGSHANAGQPFDPAFRRVLMYLLVGTKGGFNRLQIIKLLQAEPMNANKMGEKLSLDYKTIQHHLKILVENNVIVASSPPGTYGSMYFLSPYVEKNFVQVDEIWAKFGKRQI